MRNNQRVVLDTNVLVSAALSPVSPPGQVLDYLMGSGTLIISAGTFLELKTVILRPRFRRYMSLEESGEFLASLLRSSVPIEVTHSITACRDPKDDKFLELAVSGNATHIISGDRDLLALHPFRGISIVSPGDFLSETRGYLNPETSPPNLLTP